jgi:hypothetical protein
MSAQSVSPSITVKSSIKRALRLLGAKQSNEEPTNSELVDGLEAWNSMFDSWNTEHLIAAGSTRQTFTLIASQNGHTIGSGLNFDSARPSKITNVGLISSGQTKEVQLQLLNDDEYAAVADKASTGTPWGVWFDGDHTFYFVLIPDGADTFVLYSDIQLSQVTFANIETAITLPTGFKDAIDFNLAINLAAEWAIQPSPIVVSKAIATKANLKRTHIKPLSMKCDVALQPRQGYSYNIYTNEPY